MSVKPVFFDGCRQVAVEDEDAGDRVNGSIFLIITGGVQGDTATGVAREPGNRRAGR